MPGEYAEGTAVPVSKSLEEIKRTLLRFGADPETFTYAEQGRNIGIQFDMASKRVRLTMTLPPLSDFELTPTGYVRAKGTMVAEWEKACRQRWRTLALGVKAKLALIDDGISTFEREFLSDLVLPSGQTIGETLIPQISLALDGKALPSLIALGSGS